MFSPKLQIASWFLVKAAIAIFIVLLFAGCGNEKEAGHHLGEMADVSLKNDRNITKLVKTGDLHVAFDLMPIDYHKKMMKLMEVDMKKVEGESHGLMVTVMDYATKKVIQHAQVDLTVVPPNAKESVYQAEIIHGGGMHHYAVHLKALKKGIYRVKAKIQTKGKTYKASTQFKITK